MTTQTPEECEKQWLSTLEAQNNLNAQQVEAQAAAFSRPASPSQLATMANYLQEVENYVATFMPMSEYLRTAGRPRLAERVAQLMADLEGAKATYLGMYQSSVEAATRMGNMKNDVAQQWLKVQNDVLAHRQQVFDKTMDRWHNI